MYLFLLGRILFGGYFIMSGINHFRHLKMMAGYAGSKGVPMPSMAIAVSGAMLLLGGLGVLLGIREVIALYLLAIFFICVTPVMHAYWKDTDPAQKAGNRINFYKNVGLFGAILMLLALHSGAIASWALF